MRRTCPALLLLLLAAQATKIAVLEHHNPYGWSDPACARSTDDEVRCNLEVYTAAIRAARGADLILFPEGYSLAPSTLRRPTYERFESPVGSNPCASGAGPAQRALSCAARDAHIAVAASIFVNLHNGTRRIAEVVYGRDGRTLAHYDKRGLFVTERVWFSPGPFAPTTVPIKGRTYGLVVCYEGVSPRLPWGDWAQLDALNRTADAFLWSIGGVVDPERASAVIADRYGKPVVAAEGGAAAAFAGFGEMHTTTLPVAAAGYGGGGRVAVAHIRD